MREKKSKKAVLFGKKSNALTPLGCANTGTLICEGEVMLITTKEWKIFSADNLVDLDDCHLVLNSVRQSEGTEGVVVLGDKTVKWVKEAPGRVRILCIE